MLALTPAGLDALAADMADRDAWLRAALGGLSDAEVELLGIAGRLMDRAPADIKRGAPRADGWTEMTLRRVALVAVLLAGCGAERAPLGRSRRPTGRSARSRSTCPP